MLDNLPRAGCVHADDAALAQVEHIAGVRQLVLVLDGHDAEILATDELSELNTLPVHARVQGGCG